MAFGPSWASPLWTYVYSNLPRWYRSQDSTVDIATGWTTEGLGGRVPEEARFFLAMSSQLVLQLTQPPIQWIQVLSMGHEADQSRPTTAGAWGWPVTSNYCWAQEYVGLQIHSPIHVDSVLPILCKIWGLHGGNYEECRLLGCYAMWLL
jgi:hypothetical protein